ncbi:hypothetical protein APPUASWS_001215 [Arthrospira platensis str. Paraca]|nr:hypothetical protein APPUASWS_001215 [Arthrospira platensis str. Paraca]
MGKGQPSICRGDSRIAPTLRGHVLSVAVGATQFLRLRAIIEERKSQGELSHDWTLGKFAVDGFAAVGHGVSVALGGGTDGFGAGETVAKGG